MTANAIIVPVILYCIERQYNLQHEPRFNSINVPEPKDAWFMSFMRFTQRYNVLPQTSAYWGENGKERHRLFTNSEIPAQNGSVKILQSSRV